MIQKIKKFTICVIPMFLCLVLTGLTVASTIDLAWDANTEADLAGYKVYYGTQSRSYTASVDVGNSTEYTLSGLQAGVSYYICLTAYDNNFNESGYSEEVYLSAVDTDPPEIESVSCLYGDIVRVVFNEIVDKISSEQTGNYQIDNGIVVNLAERQSDKRTVLLHTNQHSNGTYVLTVSSIRDSAAVPNTMPAGTQAAYVWSGNDEDPPQIESAVLYSYDLLTVTYNEPVLQSSAVDPANYSISPQLTINSASLDGTFRKVYLATEGHQAGQTYVLTVNNILDSVNPPNQIAADTQVEYAWQSDDTTPPSLVSARALSATAVSIVFSEPLNRTTAETVSNYLISPALAVTNASLDGSGTTVTLTTAAHTGGSYSVRVSNVTDAATPPNTIESSQLNYSYTPPDVTPPQMQAVEVRSANLLRVIFNEAVARDAAENLQNYSISPAVTITNATLNFDQTVVMLETDDHAAADYRLTVNNIQDKAVSPNTIAPNSYRDYSYSPPDIDPPEITGIVMHGNDIVEVIFSEPVERTSSETAVNFQISNSISIQSATLVGDNYDRVYLQTGAHTAGVSYELTVSNVLDRASVPNVIAPNSRRQYTYNENDDTPPRLASIEQFGASVLKLTFSEALDPQTAQTAANYTFSPALEITDANLDNTGRIVFLVTETHQQGTAYTVTVSSVQDLASPPNVIGDENTLSFTSASVDVTAPQLVRAESHGNQTVELVFSEPIDPVSARNSANYSVEPGVSVHAVTLSQSQMAVFLETSPQPRGTYTVTVNNIRDLADSPNTIAAGSQVQYIFTPSDDQPPELLQAAFININTVELIFNEPLNRATAENTANYAVNNGITVVKATLDYSGTKVLLQTSAHFPETFRVTVNNVRDGSAAANAILPNTSTTYTYEVQDNTPPRIISAILRDPAHLLVTYNEAMDAATAADAANYRINNGIQVTDAVAIVSGSGQDTLGSSIPKSQVLLETSAHPAGQFLLTVNGVCDDSETKNRIADYSQIQYVWSPADTTRPRVNGALLVGNTNLKLTFSEPLDTETAKNKDNYSIQPYVEITNAFLDAELDVVWLSTREHSPGTYTVTAVNVKDRAFNANTVGSNNQAVYSYTPPDTVAPGLVSVQMKETPQMLYLQFDEPLSRTSAENAANYSVTPGITISAAYLTASLTTVMLETSPHQVNTNYEITVQGLRDRAPNPNIITSPVRGQYTFTPPDNTPPELLSVKVQGPRKLELVFSEEIEKTSAETRDNYRFDPAVEVINATLDPVSMKRVILETSDHMPGITYSISTRNIIDRASIPNTIEPNQWLSYSLPISGGSSDRTAPAVARIDIISPTEIDIVFTEPVDSNSAEAAGNYRIDGGVTVKSAEISAQLTRVHLTTSPHTDGKAYSITVSGISDLAVNPNVMSSSPRTKYLIKTGVAVSSLSRNDYEMAGFSLDNRCYLDRDYLFDQIPTCIEHTVQIFTSNDDKADTTDQFLSFEISGDATVYIAFDNQVSSKPGWLAEWKQTGEQIVNSRSDVFNVFSRSVSSGFVTLGGNRGGLDDNMYMVFVKPHISSSMIIRGLSKTGYTVKRLSAGDKYYIDRDYTLASVPGFMENMFWINTANDDKTDDSETFLSFTLQRKSMVYVAYDAMAAHVPSWLDEWLLMQEQIVDSRGVRFEIYAREYSAGDVVLAGNGGNMDDNMYLVLLNPELSEDEKDETAGPATFNLGQNYPNPFNPVTSIRFEVHTTGHVKLSVINILGQRVNVLVDEIVAGGAVREVEWDGTDHHGTRVASGVYFYRIQQGQFAKTRRMILLR